MGLMSRVLSSSGTAGGDGLLRRALELRRAAQVRPAAPVASLHVSVEPASGTLTDPEKKKPSHQFGKKAA